MDTTSLMLSVVFGALGMGYIVYGKNTGRIVPLIAGVALTGLPYFISSNVVLVVVCVALAGAPFVVRDQ